MTTHVLFPLRLGDRGAAATGTDDEYLRGLVEQVLFTRRGERVNRPRFGGGVPALIFEPLDDGLAAATDATIRTALQDALGDLIRVQDVAVVADDSRLVVTVVFRPASAPAGAEASVVLQVAGALGGAP